MAVWRVALILAIAALTQLPGSAGRPAGTEAGSLAVWRPADALGAVAAGFGDLWVDDRAGERLLRVDGATGRVRAEVPVAGRIALAAGRRAVWALQSGGGYGLGLRGPLLRIDPRTGRVRARIPLGGALGFGVRPTAGGAWVWGPSDILRVDGRAGRVVRRIPVGGAHGELTGLAVAGRRLLAGTADGHLLRFDARTGRRTRVTDMGVTGPALRALGGGRLVFTASGTVGAFDLAAGRVAWRRRLGYRAGATLGPDGLVWAHSAATHEEGDRVTALRLDTGRVVASRTLPHFGTTGVAAAAGRVAIPTAGGALVVLTPRRPT